MSILEISTIGYAFCTIFAYLLWWKKPRIMSEPTVFNAERKMDYDNAMLRQLRSEHNYYPDRDEIPDQDNTDVTESSETWNESQTIDDTPHLVNKDSIEEDIIPRPLDLQWRKTAERIFCSIIPVAFTCLRGIRNSLRTLKVSFGASVQL